jgi:hypothetical protein
MLPGKISDLMSIACEEISGPGPRIREKSQENPRHPNVIALRRNQMDLIEEDPAANEHESDQTSQR